MRAVFLSMRAQASSSSKLEEVTLPQPCIHLHAAFKCLHAPQQWRSKWTLCRRSDRGLTQQRLSQRRRTSIDHGDYEQLASATKRSMTSISTAIVDTQRMLFSQPLIRDLPYRSTHYYEGTGEVLHLPRDGIRASSSSQRLDYPHSLLRSQ